MSLMEEVQPPLPEDDLWNRNVEAVDTFTLAHEDLCVSTNSLQVSKHHEYEFYFTFR